MKTTHPFTMHQHLAIAAALFFLMLLTRASHMLTNVTLPDASLAVFLLGGMYLRRVRWFALFFMLAATIDFGAATWNPYYGFCLTNGYWGLIPTYGMMWFGGHWLTQHADAFAIDRYLLVTLATTFLAFLISTQTYYLFSGRFPNHGLHDTIQHGWNYLPSYLGYAMIYFAFIWLAAHLLRHVRAWRKVHA